MAWRALSSVRRHDEHSARSLARLAPDLRACSVTPCASRSVDRVKTFRNKRAVSVSLKHVQQHSMAIA